MYIHLLLKSSFIMPLYPACIESTVFMMIKNKHPPPQVFLATERSSKKKYARELYYARGSLYIHMYVS